ncbi:adenylate/guanylate cyclase domain-containing protein [soil metagenome]
MPSRAASPNRFRLRALGIQSKLLIVLIVTSVVSVLVAGTIGYVSGTDSLRAAEFNRMTQLRESRAREITHYFDTTADAASIVTHGTTTVNAVRDFSAAFTELDATVPPPEAKAAVTRYYETVFAPALSERTGEQADPTLFEPTGNAAIYLQNAYTVPADGDFDAALADRSAADPSAWSAANARYQGFFADLTTRFGFEDSLILDTDGNVVYSAYKGAELGTNLFNGPYRTSLLADGYRDALQANSVDQTFITDTERYPPSYDKPTSWVLSPIGNGGNIAGVLALQLSLDGINNVMTGDNGWVTDGLGTTGETYLAGPDKLMRSVSRELLTNPDGFVDAVVDNGTPIEVAERELAVKGSVLLQPVDTLAVNRAQQGESGVATDNDYIGPTSLVSYMPLDIPGLDWVLVAKIDENEALAPVNTFARNIALSTAAIVLVVCVLALILSRLLTRPLTRLATAVRRVTSGELGVRVPVTTKDEFGVLAAEFNDMSDSLRTKQELIDAQRRENDELLATLMPEPLAQRFRDGETTISTDYRDVSVVYAEVLNFKDFAQSLSSEDSVRLLNTLIESFDAAAEHHGIERVRNLHNGFLATCGLVVPRVDHASRTVAFATELVEVVDLFNDQQNAQLALRVGIDSGPVSSGLLGQRSRIYDLWGEAVDLAHRVHASSNRAGIFVSNRVRESLGAFHTFTEEGTVVGADGSEPVWSLQVSTRATT